MTLLTTLLAFAVTLGILITIHEFGHYWVARRFGVKILRFSIGFGKPLFTWKRKNDPDQTEWSIAMLPLGGYVKMLDERDPDCLPIKPDEVHRSFGSKNVFQRFAIVLAGPLSNLLLAILLYAALFMGGSVQPLPVIDEPAPNTPAAMAGIHSGDQIMKVDGADVPTYTDLRFEIIRKAGSEVTLLVKSLSGAESEKRLDLTGFNIDQANDPERDPFEALGLNLRVGQPFIQEVIPDSAAQKVGLQKGDKLLAVNGQTIKTPKEFIELIRQFPDQKISLKIKNKEGVEKLIEITPLARINEAGEKIGQIGAAIGVDFPKTTVRYGPIKSVWEGAKKTWDTATMSLSMIGKMITGEASVKNLSGPVTIADYAGQTARMGVTAFISFLALVSISLGILNLLPIPMLDGGHLLYYSVEIIRGKPVSESFQLAAQKVGIVALCGLTFLALFNDLSRLLP